MQNFKNFKKTLSAGAFVAVLGAGALFATGPVALADVACNRAGECWNTSHRYSEYPPHLGVQFYANDWRESHRTDTHYRWMKDQDPDRGYYSEGEWHAFGK
jgi:hypothetical protein